MLTFSTLTQKGPVSGLAAQYLILKLSSYFKGVMFSPTVIVLWILKHIVSPKVSIDNISIKQFPKMDFLG